MKVLILAALAATAAITAAQAAPGRAAHGAAEPQASIPFVNHGGIRDWQSANRDTLYIQDRSRNWYRAELFGGCFDLPFAQAIGFQTGAIDRFDRFSSVVVGGQRCMVQSLVRSDAPPARLKKHRS